MQGRINIPETNKSWVSTESKISLSRFFFLYIEIIPSLLKDKIDLRSKADCKYYNGVLIQTLDIIYIWESCSAVNMRKTPREWYSFTLPINIFVF